MAMQPMLLYGMVMKLTLLGVVMAATATPAKAQAKPGCQRHCGNVSIPYPFGTTEDCYMSDHFLITCNTSFNPPKAFLSRSRHTRVINISLQGQLHISKAVTYFCKNSSTNMVDPTNSSWHWNPKFPISYTKNKFTAVGCNIFAYMQSGDLYAPCVTTCQNSSDIVNGSCSSIGCCQSNIPKRTQNYSIDIVSIDNFTAFDSCVYGFIVEDGAFNFSSIDLYNLQNRTRFPVVLDWSIGNQTCHEAKKNATSYACKENSYCIDSENGSGYLCSCTDGFQGNPYLTNGCQDINECDSLKPCSNTCHNVPGSYYCSCPIGYEGNGWKNGTGCTFKVIPNHQSKRFPNVNIAVGAGIGLIFILVGFSLVYLGLRQIKLIKLREKCFQQNGGNLLRQHLSKREESGETATVFTAKDLKKATNNYHESQILGQGGQGTVYKGTLTDNRTVAIKKSRIGDKSLVEQFINEVIVLSQINHRHVVKLLGCCLETQVPLLVYEFVTNGTLFDHMHNPQRSSLIPWETRLKIATQTAGALSYLHSAASTPIIHRDVKLTNILLDDNFNAKVSDFGASRLIPLDQIQLTTLVQGTIGYLDPEYFRTSQLTEKSDVYSFGVVLVELLTGKKALCFSRPEEDRNVTMYFVRAMKENRLPRVLDQRVLNESNFEQLKQVAVLARRCVRVKGKERPTMKEIASELEGLRAVERSPRDEGDLDSEDVDEICSIPGGGTLNGNAGYDSIRSQVTFEIEGGR